MIEIVAIDVDGTLTDGGVYYDDNGNELKKFNVKDGVGFLTAKKAGLKTMVLTGRESAATLRRMNELKVDYIFQNVEDKKSFLKQFMEKESIIGETVGYIGDDINDLGAMDMVGFTGCPADACNEVLEVVDYISTRKGGYGAVRDVIEHILKEQGIWEKILLNDCYENEKNIKEITNK